MVRMNVRVLLHGPSYGRFLPRGYGGGTGGYTRNMQCYLESLHVDGVSFAPMFHSVRGEYEFLGRPGLLSYSVRFLLDVMRGFVQMAFRKCDVVHILGAYKNAISREAAIVLLCKILRKKIVYDIKGGIFIDQFMKRSWIYRRFVEYIINNADVILSEGVDNVHFIKRKFNIDVVYFPNFVPDSEIPKKGNNILEDNLIRVIYVGYCHKTKGVFQLVEACVRAAEAGISLELHLIGQEELTFKQYVDEISEIASFSIVRHGRSEHPFVLEKLECADVYCCPTAHYGEGHNNSINEAMMFGLAIISTRHGYIPDVLGKQAVLLESNEPKFIADAIEFIANNRVAVKAMGVECRQRFLENFTSSSASKNLEKTYRERNIIQ